MLNTKLFPKNLDIHYVIFLILAFFMKNKNLQVVVKIIIGLKIFENFLVITGPFSDDYVYVIFVIKLTNPTSDVHY